MKYELTHDILARKIKTRVPHDYQYQRRVKEFIRKRFEFYLERGELLTEEALDYIKPHLDAVNTSLEEDIYINESREFYIEQRAAARRKEEAVKQAERDRKERDRKAEVERKEKERQEELARKEAEIERQKKEQNRLRRWLTFAGFAILVILTLLVTTILFFNSSRKAQQKAEQNSFQANKNLALVFFEQYKFDSARQYFNKARLVSINASESEKIDSLILVCNTHDEDFKKYRTINPKVDSLEKIKAYREASLLLTPTLDLKLKPEMKSAIELRTKALEQARSERYAHFKDRRKVSLQNARETSNPALKRAFQDSVKKYDALLYKYRPIDEK